MYIDLIEKLSADDKKRINNYITKWGVPAEKFIGLDKWLQNWSHSNQKLYKLLGNQFIKEFDIRFAKESSVLRNEMAILLKSVFKGSYHNFYINILKQDENMPPAVLESFSRLSDLENFINDSIAVPIKYKRKDSKKTLQIQKGMKPMRAFQKVVEYYKDIYFFVGFEEFKNQHSLILNNKYTAGKLCVSIHPLDFMTMSDNASNWSSCMSWINQGCYEVGTIEMMNSNNVLCCYLKGHDSFHFGKDVDLYNDPFYCWNNKKWRQLVYITKDILMGGKAYPYQSKDMTFALLSFIKDLAKENMNWIYTFGPELYQDMIHINNSHAMNLNHKWILEGDTFKHNIIWDTKGMYNDMLNDSETPYWCYRNKVRRNKIISVSGKNNCLCCNAPISYLTTEYNYNDRYENTGLVCKTCLENYFFCSCCCDQSPRNLYVSLNIKRRISPHCIYTSEKSICKDCWNERVKICPECGQIFYIEGDLDNCYDTENVSAFAYLIDNFDLKYISRVNWQSLPQTKTINRDGREINLIYPLFACGDCVNKIKEKNNIVEKKYNFYYIDTAIQKIPIFMNINIGKKYLYTNLDKVDFPENLDNKFELISNLS